MRRATAYIAIPVRRLS